MKKIYLSNYAKSAFNGSLLALSTVFLHSSVSAQQTLVITEIMANPSAVTDAAGEWFEIYNKGASAVGINKLILSSGSSKDTLFSVTPVILPPGAYFVFGTNVDMNTNGNVKIDYAYDRIGLANAEDDITISDSNGVQIDKVTYLTSKSGESYSLSTDHLDATENDTPSNWCFGVTPYNSSDAGTPGAANDCHTIATSLISQDALALMITLKDRKLHFTGAHELQASLFDHQGKLQQSAIVSNNHELDLSSYPSGLYIVKIVNREKEQSFKIVLQ